MTLLVSLFAFRLHDYTCHRYCKNCLLHSHHPVQFLHVHLPVLQKKIVAIKASLTLTLVLRLTSKCSKWMLEFKWHRRWNQQVHFTHSQTVWMALTYMYIYTPSFEGNQVNLIFGAQTTIPKVTCSHSRLYDETNSINERPDRVFARVLLTNTFFVFKVNVGLTKLIVIQRHTVMFRSRRFDLFSGLYQAWCVRTSIQGIPFI